MINLCLERKLQCVQLPCLQNVIGRVQRYGKCVTTRTLRKGDIQRPLFADLGCNKHHLKEIVNLGSAL